MKFKARLKLIGINPYVTIPPLILTQLFKKAGKDKGHIPIHGLINNKRYRQTLVKYKGDWRLYVNTQMLKDSPKRIGELVSVSIAIDTADRTIQPHPDFIKALSENTSAKKTFDELPPSRKKEVVRYISALKKEESRARSIEKAIAFLTGKGRFVGRDRP